MHSNPKNIVAYFDFDGTLTMRDTLVPFLIYVCGLGKFIRQVPIIMPWVILYGLKFIDNENLKQRMLRLMIKGASIAELENKAKKFAQTNLNKYLEPDIYAKMEWHIEQGHSVYLVSANLALYLKYWAKLHKLSGVIATEIEFVAAKCTGNLASRNCYGAQKVLRVNQYLQEKNLHYAYSYGYGNSRGDYELLTMCNEGFFVSGEDIAVWEQNGAN